MAYQIKRKADTLAVTRDGEHYAKTGYLTNHDRAKEIFTELDRNSPESFDWWALQLAYYVAGAPQTFNWNKEETE